MQQTKHSLADKTCKIKNGFTDHYGNEHSEVIVEDAWKNVTGESWERSAQHGSPAALNYARRTNYGEGFKDSEDVVYGKTGRFGNLFNAEELEECQ